MIQALLRFLVGNQEEWAPINNLGTILVIKIKKKLHWKVYPRLSFMGHHFIREEIRPHEIK